MLYSTFCTRENKIDLSRSVRATASSRVWRDLGRDTFFSPRSRRRRKEVLLAGWAVITVIFATFAYPWINEEKMLLFWLAVSHDNLLAKLEFYGVRGVALQWFKSYLSCRTQFVQYNGYNSSSKYLKYGVPQRSILGPLLFLLYINDLCNMSKALNFILFADDTNIFFSHNDPNQVMEIVNNELKKLSGWFYANKLSINIKKSNFILFKTKQNKTGKNLTYIFQLMILKLIV